MFCDCSVAALALDPAVCFFGVLTLLPQNRCPKHCCQRNLRNTCLTYASNGTHCLYGFRLQTWTHLNPYKVLNGKSCLRRRLLIEKDPKHRQLYIYIHIHTSFATRIKIGQKEPGLGCFSVVGCVSYGKPTFIQCGCLGRVVFSLCGCQAPAQHWMKT